MFRTNPFSFRMQRAIPAFALLCAAFLLSHLFLQQALASDLLIQPPAASETTEAAKTETTQEEAASTAQPASTKADQSDAKEKTEESTTQKTAAKTETAPAETAPATEVENKENVQQPDAEANQQAASEAAPVPSVPSPLELLEAKRTQLELLKADVELAIQQNKLLEEQQKGLKRLQAVTPVPKAITTKVSRRACPTLKPFLLSIQGIDGRLTATLSLRNSKGERGILTVSKSDKVGRGRVTAITRQTVTIKYSGTTSTLTFKAQ